MASVPEGEAECGAVEAPYWQLREDDTDFGLASIARRVKQAAGPMIDALMAAGGLSFVVILVCQMLSGLGLTFLLVGFSDALDMIGGAAPAATRSGWTLYSLLLAMAGIFLLRVGLDFLGNLKAATIAPAIRYEAEQALYRRCLEVDLKTFEDDRFYDQLLRARDRGVFHLEDSYRNFIAMARASLNALAAAVGVTIINPWLLPLLILVLLPEGWALFLAARNRYRAHGAYVTLYRQVDLIANLCTDRANAAEIRANQAQPYLIEEFKRFGQILRCHVELVQRYDVRVLALGKFLSAVVLIALGGLILMLLRGGVVPLVGLAAVAIALQTATGALTALIQAAQSIFDKALYVSDFHAFVAVSANPSEALTEAPNPPGEVKLEGVSFRYPGQCAHWVLSNISLTIRPGEIIALVGENGSGKSTLAKVLSGLFPPDEGIVSWSGRDLRTMTPASIADRVIMVFQHPVRWPRSARDNVRLGRYNRVDPDDQFLQAAARDAQADGVVARLLQGWHTLLSKEFRGGQDLSSGQWQKLAIARGLFRDAPLVIWDEPTAPLDPRSEYAVYENLRRLGRNRTVILITHRLASVREANRIFLLDEGKIAETGTHGELIALGGKYAELYAIQKKINDEAGWARDGGLDD